MFVQLTCLLPHRRRQSTILEDITLRTLSPSFRSLSCLVSSTSGAIWSGTTRYLSTANPGSAASTTTSNAHTTALPHFRDDAWAMPPTPAYTYPAPGAPAPKEETRINRQRKWRTSHIQIRPQLLRLRQRRFILQLPLPLPIHPFNTICKCRSTRSVVLLLC